MNEIASHQAETLRLSETEVRIVLALRDTARRERLLKIKDGAEHD